MTYLNQKKVPLCPKIVLWFIRIVFSCEIPVNVKIGKRTILKHNGLGVVIHEHAIIGEDVVIMQNVTIGGRNGRGAPTIGNNVFIGVGACILGNVKVGNYSSIGANAVVIMDIPDHAVAVGVPAKVIKINNSF